MSPFRKRRAKEPDVLIGDPRVDGWETVSTFEDATTALAWRDQLRAMGVDASCAADYPLDQWSRANEIVENLD
jgi:hypothetical protein